MSDWITEPIVALIPVVGAMIVLIVLNERDTLTTPKGTAIAAAALVIASIAWVGIGHLAGPPDPEQQRAEARRELARDLIAGGRLLGEPVARLHAEIGAPDGLRDRPGGAVLIWTLGPREAGGGEEALVAQIGPDRTIRALSIEVDGRSPVAGQAPQATG